MILTKNIYGMLVKETYIQMDLGFNGSRLHEKVFEERFLYHYDRLGYIVWGEYPNWELDHTKPEFVYHFTSKAAKNCLALLCLTGGSKPWLFPFSCRYLSSSKYRCSLLLYLTYSRNVISMPAEYFSLRKLIRCSTLYA